mgnify:CR=1 FL=1
MHIPASRLLSLLLIPPVLGGVLTWSALSARAADGAAQVPAALLTPAQGAQAPAMEDLPFYRPELAGRYGACQAAHPDWTAARSVLWVNMELDHPFYTGTDTVEQPDSLTALVNKYHLLPADYAPQVEAGYGSGSLRPQAAAAFRAMADAARADGISLRSVSAYRSYARQESTYNRWLSQDSQASVDTYSARPGASEHQTGLALDINVASLKAHFEDTPAYAWLAEHCAEYGFILRYPQGKEHITGYQFEPWHYRYVGVEVAQVCMDRGLTLEEYFALRPAQEEEPEAAPEAADPEPAQTESAAPAQPVAPDPQPDPDLPMI